MNAVIPISQLKAAPPLSQSRRELLACNLLYVSREIEGIKPPPSEAAHRGVEIHRVMSRYVDYLVKKRVKADWAEFERLCFGVSPEAKDILASVQERFELADPEHVVGTELHWMFDANLEPVKNGRADYEMTVDVLEMPNAETAIVTDYKSYFRLIDADSFQGAIYSLGAFLRNPNLQSVTFRLVFVRWGAKREKTYTRADVPALISLVKGERDRQLAIHAAFERGEELEALPGKHCLYCPLLFEHCPWQYSNTWARERETVLKRALYLGMAYDETMAMLKEMVGERDAPVAVTVETSDGNGHKYVARWGVKSVKHYPAIETIPILLDHKEETGEDLLAEAHISGLGAKLKAKMREQLAEKLANVAEMETQGSFIVDEAG